MNKENLYKLLEIDCPEDFDYFENFADLIESNEDFSFDDLIEIFSVVNIDNVSMIIENYFKEVLDSLSSESIELTTIFENEKRVLIGLLRNQDKDGVNLFVTELERFREYYSINEYVEINDLKDNDRYMASICDSLFTIRQEKFDGSVHRCNFSNVLDYEFDEYIMSFADLVDLEYEEYEN